MSETETPLMKQYNTFKAKYPDAILLFRVGDFYETFGEDAKRASATLGITLTKRSNEKASSVELAGFLIIRLTPTYLNWFVPVCVWRFATRLKTRSLLKEL